MGKNVIGMTTNKRLSCFSLAMLNWRSKGLNQTFSPADYGSFTAKRA